MRGPMRALITLSAAMSLSACFAREENPSAAGENRKGGAEAPSGAEGELFDKAAVALAPLHRKKTPGSWMLGPGSDETGQTFAEYLDSDPVRPDGKRRTLYITLLGDFEGESQKIVDLCAGFMGLYFNLPVKFADPIPLSEIPRSARRVHPSWKMKQIHAGYILDRVLPKRVPEDAVALIAFTTSDLYPEESWNFVFGMASLQRRVGVWSIYRYGDPSAGEEEFRLCLKRTIKVGTHESGHMFGLPHCTSYECNMNGSNSLPESDACPLALCPECVRKIWWACKCDPLERYGKLEEFCRRQGMKAEADFFKASMERLEPVFRREEKD